MTDETRVPLNRIERLLAVFIAVTAGMSVLAVAVVIGAGLLGVEDLSEGIWPVIAILPVVGLPIAFALILTFAIVTAVRRSRLQRDGGR